MFTRGEIFCQSLQLLPKLDAFMKILSEYFSVMKIYMDGAIEYFFSVYGTLHGKHWL